MLFSLPKGVEWLHLISQGRIGRYSSSYPSVPHFYHLSYSPSHQVHLTFCSSMSFLLFFLFFLSISCQEPGIHLAPPLTWPLNQMTINEMVQIWGIKAGGSSTTVFQDPSLNPMFCPTGSQNLAPVPPGSQYSIPSCNLPKLTWHPCTWLHPAPSPRMSLLSARTSHNHWNQPLLLSLLDPENQVRAPSSGQEEKWHPLASPRGQTLEEVSTGQTEPNKLFSSSCLPLLASMSFLCCYFPPFLVGGVCWKGEWSKARISPFRVSTAVWACSHIRLF